MAQGIDSTDLTQRNESGTMRDALGMMSTPGNAVDTQQDEGMFSDLDGSITNKQVTSSLQSQGP